MEVDEKKKEPDFTAIPSLPPPQSNEPALPPRSADRLRRAYVLWCVVTISAALGALLLLGINTLERIRSEGDGYLRTLFFERILGAGEENGLIELILAQTLYARAEPTILPADTAAEDLPVVLPSEETSLTPETSAPAAQEQIDIYAFDRSQVPEGEYPILPLDLSLVELGSLYISNETTYTPDIAALLEKENILPAYKHASATVYPPGDPLVLILHTHGTEAYSPEGAISYADAADYARSTDTDENVVAVGERMAEVLRERGIPTLHCTVLHDKDAYRDAYLNAAETIRTYLARYPSIQYIFDVHRDGLIRGEADLVRPVTLIDSEAVAQVMILAGSDYKGAVFPDWETNLAFALQLREALNTDYERLARPVYLRGAAFNEHYGPHSLLLEIGASGNSLPEALRAGELVAETLAQMIRGERT